MADEQADMTVAVKYDPSIIQQLANALYDQAKIIVFMFTVLGISIGGYIGYFVISRGDLMYGCIGAAICGLIGYAIGQPRAFTLKLQAQVALCQVEIERNTRR